MINRASLKSVSKQQLNRNWNWKIPVVLMIISFLLGGMTEYYADKPILAFVVTVLSGILGVYLTVSYVKIARSKEDEVVRFKDLKVTFSMLIKTLLLSMLVGIIIFMSTLISGLISVFLLAINSILGGVAIILTVSIVIAISVYTVFAITLIVDKNVGVIEALELSVKLVKGDFWSLVVLGLSFILWIILVVVTFGIAVLWVVPYIEITYVNCYLELYAKKIEGKHL